MPEKQILLADTQLPARTRFGHELEKSGYKVHLARDGEEALEILQAQPIDVALVDPNLPRLNGYQVFHTAQAHPRLALIPFIFISEQVSSGDLRYARSIGVMDYLRKDTPAEDVRAVVRGQLLYAERLRSLFEPELAVVEAGLVELTVQGRALRIDPGQTRCWLAGAEVELTQREFFLLERLARHPNLIVDMRDLYALFQGGEPEASLIVAGDLVRPHVCRLRQKLRSRLGGQDCIRNVRGRGYMLVAGRRSERMAESGQR